MLSGINAPVKIVPVSVALARLAERSTDWVLRLGDGTEESHRRMQAAIDELWMYTGELFETDEIDREMVQRGVGADLESLHPAWISHVEKTFTEATLQLPSGNWMQRGGKQGVHTEELSYLLAEMQVLPRAFSGAVW